MTTRYSNPTVESILEDSENDIEQEKELAESEDDRLNDFSYRQAHTGEVTTGPVNVNAGRAMDKTKRSHKSGTGRRRHSRREERNTSTTKYAGMPGREDAARTRQPRIQSYRNPSPASSSSSGEEGFNDERVASQARSKLTSPSIISTLTTLTTSTNNSGGSSGSNSTITQASINKPSAKSIGARPEIPETPMSPAVPDPPDVFAYLETESTLTLPVANEDDSEGESGSGSHGDDDGDSASDSASEEEGEVHEAEEDSEEDNEQEDEEDEHNNTQWAPPERLAILPSPTSLDHVGSSSSTASSFHGSDHFSETHAENDDTDRSTSPENSVRDGSDHEEGLDVPPSPASDKVASQMAAAQERQNLYSNTSQCFGTPNMPRGNTVYPYVPANSPLNPRYQQHIKQRSLPRAEKLPVTGYELLASRLSHANAPSEEPKIKPMYRKFEALNHRLLLHLQDEISELEEQLHRLDNADTQSRRAGLSGSVVPASRRAAQAAGGELQWHKTDILGRIGFKLNQYNQALSAFNATQALNPPDPSDIDHYREYLHTEHPIAEAETHFLDPTDDLVSVCSETVRPYVPSFNPDTQTSASSSVAFEHGEQNELTRRRSEDHDNPGLSGLALAIAVAVLVPILTFNVIPNFIGRITVAGLVAGGVVFTLIQSRAVRGSILGREGLICGGIYGGVMIVLAGIIG